ncbi:hypothetical protein D9619_001588 [Psilocybe cf. subviscida]|uniref:Uncharacterized protein n=1 Tax=Psilocybe cf. subviscida TaxID=2480587 RepID=A0A8H5BFN4_9AGAR|nr:hypothetical protein D9619_001588 [Psilocybe cf. subviscida]
MTLSDLRFLVASDVFLAVLIPLVILFFGSRHLPSLADLRSLLSLHKSAPSLRHHGNFSLERAYASFTQYTRLSAEAQATMRASYARLGRTGKRVGFAVGYPAKLERLRDATARNAVLADGIAECAAEEYAGRLTPGSLSSRIAGAADLGRVREAMKHFVRDWSEEGRGERTRIFEPVLELLRKVKQKERESMRVLVPGCGLGRLAWEISELGKSVLQLIQSRY